jgi:hypothetical protein
VSGLNIAIFADKLPTHLRLTVEERILARDAFRLPGRLLTHDVFASPRPSPVRHLAFDQPFVNRLSDLLRMSRGLGFDIRISSFPSTASSLDPWPPPPSSARIWCTFTPISGLLPIRDGNRLASRGVRSRISLQNRRTHRWARHSCTFSNGRNSVNQLNPD